MPQPRAILRQGASRHLQPHARPDRAAGRRHRPGAAREVSARPGLLAHLPRTEAYRLYLQGRYYSMQNTPGGFQQAHDYFEQATKIDAQFARRGSRSRSRICCEWTSVAAALPRPRPQPSRHWRGHNSSIPARQNCWPCAVSWRSTTATTRRRPMRCARQPPCVPATVKLTCGGTVFLAQGEVRRAASVLQRAYDLDPDSTIAALTSAW